MGGGGSKDVPSSRHSTTVSNMKVIMCLVLLTSLGAEGGTLLVDDTQSVVSNDAED
jgi:hypothetical protein